MRGFRLPRGRSKDESSGSGIERPSLLKPVPSLVKKRADKNDHGASLQTRMFEFYDEILKEAERFVETVQDEATAAKAKEQLRMSLIPPGSRGKMTPEMFQVKAQRVITLMRRVESATLRAPPTKPKPKRCDDKPSVGRLSATQLQLNIQSTVMAGRLRHYDLPLAGPGETELGSGCAIPLCLPNDMKWNPQTRKYVRLKDVTRKSLNLIPQALDILKSISGPVCVVAIVGPCRSGKSYILSHLIGSKGGVCYFDLGHKMDSHTMGIWMWDKPFKVTLKSGEVVTMVLLDTEGIDAAGATEQGDNQIFTLSVLLSSLLIYNSMNVPRRDDLNQMHYIANLSRSVQVQTGKSAEGEGGVQLSDCNPCFMWLLRDVTLEPTDRNERPCHVKDYLLQQVLNEDKAGDEVQRSIRQCLLSFFSAFDSETLPPPSTDPNVMRNMDKPLYQQHINPIFLQKVEYVRKRILANCSAKRGFTRGSVVSGFQLAQLVLLYVEALNAPGGVPVVGSTWQRVLEATYKDGMDRSVACYREIMEKKTKSLPMENEQLLAHHREAVDKCLEIFKQAATLDSATELYETFLDKLMAQLASYSPNGACTGGLLAEYLQKNHDKSRSTCQALLDRLREEHLSPLIRHMTPQTDFHAIERVFTAVLSKYNQESVGPAADDVLQRFLEEQEKERERLEDQLRTIKNYDAEATERMRELREHQRLIKKQEREKADLVEKMVQSRRDQEARLKAMESKYSQDAEKLRQESTQRLEEHEKRLQNMADAQLQDLRSQNETELKDLRSELASKESELRAQHNRMQQEIEKKIAEIQRLQWEQEQEREREQQRRKEKCCLL